MFVKYKDIIINISRSACITCVKVDKFEVYIAYPGQVTITIPFDNADSLQDFYDYIVELFRDYFEFHEYDLDERAVFPRRVKPIDDEHESWNDE